MADNVFPSVPAAGGLTGDYQRFSSAFPDPFFDYASTQMPRSLPDVLKWTEFLYLTNGTYRTAAQRIVRYFLTKVELDGGSDEEKTKYEDFLDKQIKIMTTLAAIGDDWFAYGNSLTSIRIPFRRYLRCRKCKHERALDQISYTFEKWSFRATCPSCKWTGEFERVDRRSVEQDKIRIIRWSPHEIRIQHHPVSHDTMYYWVPPADFCRELRRGNKFFIATTPWEIIEAVKNKEWFRFNPGVIYHMKEETLAGVRNVGWGIPRILANFKQAWYVQVLKRYNEAIGLDYIIPFRIITPGKGSGSADVDPLLHINAGSFMQRVLGMIQKHRKDPASWNALPFPVDYQALSGEGKQLAPFELLNAAVDELLNDMGFPAEMYKATLSVQAAPMALRLFERTWTHLVSGLNGWLNWFFETVTDVLNWEKLSGRMQPVTLAEDMERKQVLLQLSAAQQISKQTALAPFGVDWMAEVERQFDEEKLYQTLSKRFQKEQAQAQQMEQTFEAAQQPQMPGMPGGMPGMAGGMPGAPMPAGGGMMPGGMPGGMPGAGGTTPADLLAQAEQVAMQMLSMPYGARKSELLKIKKADATLHAMVIQKMDEIRGQAKQQGGQQMLQQAFGPTAG